MTMSRYDRIHIKHFRHPVIFQSCFIKLFLYGVDLNFEFPIKLATTNFVCLSF